LFSVRLHNVAENQPGKSDACPADPVEASDADTLLRHLQARAN